MIPSLKGVVLHTVILTRKVSVSHVKKDISSYYRYEFVNFISLNMYSIRVLQLMATDPNEFYMICHAYIFHVIN